MGWIYVGCRIRLLKLRVITEAHWIDRTGLVAEPVDLHWKSTYLDLNYGADLELEGQGNQC